MKDKDSEIARTLIRQAQSVGNELGLNVDQLLLLSIATSLASLLAWKENER